MPIKLTVPHHEIQDPGHLRGSNLLMTDKLSTELIHEKHERERKGYRLPGIPTANSFSAYPFAC